MRKLLRHDLELAAIIFALNIWRRYLYEVYYEIFIENFLL